MKTILIILFFSTCGLLSQWSKITYPPVSTSFVFTVKDDTLYAFKSYVGWYKSYDSGETWEQDKSHFVIPNGRTPVSTLCAPYFDNNIVYAPAGIAGSSHSLHVSYDYGKTFFQTNVVNYHRNRIDDIYVIKAKDNLVVVGGHEGLFVSYDYGKNFYKKDKPGVIQYSSGHVLDPEEYGIYLASASAVNGVLIKDDFILLTSRGQGPAIFKTVKYDLYDSLRTKYYNATYMYFVNKFGEDSTENRFLSVDARLLVEIKNRIFTVFYDNVEYAQIWYSDDEGDSWEELNTENIGLKKVRLITNCGDVLYATPIKGPEVFMSTDLGTTWEVFDKGFNEVENEHGTDKYLDYLQFSENYAFIKNGYSIYRAPLEDCKIVSGATSVESKEEQEVSVYPNPVKDIIKLNTNTPLRLVLYDIFGNKVLEDTNTQLNVQHLNTGTYYLKYGNETKLIIKY